MYIKPGAKLTVGDGGHRTDAYSDVIQAHSHGDEVLDRLAANGQPVIVVIDDDPLRRAQDFTDLQNNSKPLNASVAQSMDRRQRINRLLVDRLIKESGVPVLNGQRIEFLSDTPGKLSTKFMGYKSLRYACGTLLIGSGARSTRAWEEAVELALDRNETSAYEALVEFWTGFGNLPAVRPVIAGESSAAQLRATTWLLSANVIYCIAAAVHDAQERTGHTITEIMAAIGKFDFGRSGDLLDGTLVDPVTGKAVTGRDALDAFAKRLGDDIDRALVRIPAAV